jgi:hypothetical protein
VENWDDLPEMNSAASESSVLDSEAALPCLVLRTCLKPVKDNLAKGAIHKNI